MGLQNGDRVWYGEPVPQDRITEDAFVLSNIVAQRLKEKEVPPPVVLGPVPSPGPVAPITATARAFRKISLRATVPWDKLPEMVRGVKSPLRQEGAQISLKIKIDEDSEKGISRDTVDLRIKEKFSLECAGMDGLSYLERFHRDTPSTLNVDNRIMYTAGAAANLFPRLLESVFTTEAPPYAIGILDS